MFDDDVVRAPDLSLDLQLNHAATSSLTDWGRDAKAALANKSPGEIDGAEILAIKGRIRRNEAIAGHGAGVPEEHCHPWIFLFYETGRVTKKSLAAEVAITVDMLRSVQPHMIFAAGDLIPTAPTAPAWTHLPSH